MQLKIDIPTRCLLVSVENAGPFIASLSAMKAVTESGWGKDKKWEVSEERIQVEVVPDDFTATKPEPLQVALDNYEAAQKRWLEEYTKRSEQEKKVKELQARLDAMLDAADPTKQTPVS